MLGNIKKEICHLGSPISRYSQRLLGDGVSPLFGSHTTRPQVQIKADFIIIIIETERRAKLLSHFWCVFIGLTYAKMSAVRPAVSTATTSEHNNSRSPPTAPLHVLGSAVLQGSVPFLQV